MTGDSTGWAAASAERRGPSVEITTGVRAETLQAPHVGAALRLIGGVFGEIPVYRWILGDHVDDADACTALAALIAGPVVDAGGLLGVREGERVVAAMVWHPPTVDGTADADRLAGELQTLAARPDMARRLLDFWSMNLMPAPVDDAVGIAVAATDPGVRRSGMLYAMVRHVEDYCIEHDVPYYAWTGLERLRDVYRDSFGLSAFATERFEDTTLYGMVSERPPVPARLLPSTC